MSHTFSSTPEEKWIIKIATEFWKYIFFRIFESSLFEGIKCVWVAPSCCFTVANTGRKQEHTTPWCLVSCIFFWKDLHYSKNPIEPKMSLDTTVMKPWFVIFVLEYSAVLISAIRFVKREHLRHEFCLGFDKLSHLTVVTYLQLFRHLMKKIESSLRETFAGKAHSRYFPILFSKHPDMMSREFPRGRGIMYS